LDLKFDFDPCPLNSKKDNLKEESEWGEVNFVNPPYCASKGKSNGPKGFLIKALSEAEKGKTSVFFNSSLSKYSLLEGFSFSNLLNVDFFTKRD